MLLKADFHIHSKYTPGAEKRIDLKEIVKFAKIKGLNLLGTGDALHPEWRKILKENLKKEGEIYELEEIYFIPSVEIRLNTFIHSVILLPTLESFDDLYNKLKNYGKLDKTGTPVIKIDNKEIVDIIKELDGILIPAHIFVPWQSLYAKYNSIKEAFGEREKNIVAVELGLSADPEMADKVEELRERSFLSNSDAHTLWELGREFNLIEVEDLSYKGIINAIERGKIVNFEEIPALGKYHLTRCRKCLTFFKYEDAKLFRFECPKCGDKIYLGVRDRIEKELSKGDYKTRRNFKYTITLQKLLEYFLNFDKNKAREISLTIVRKIEISEVDLINFVDLKEVKISDEIKEAIERFRSGNYFVYPGGGGVFGKIVFEEPKIEFYERRQKTLFDFSEARCHH